MLQSLRDNLKGTVAIFVIVIFVVPLVLFGVEQLFVGSVGGTDAAVVNGEGISRRDLQRELVLEKQRLQQQFDLEPNSPELDDSQLTGPVLQRMVQREALVQAAKDAGMGASKELLWKQIAAIEAFQVDGRFNEALFRERISYIYTPATFLAASAQDLILGHLNAGVAASTFVTPMDLETLASITKQKRTFFSIEIPKANQADIDISAEEIEAYYQQNTAQFTEPEKVSVEYVELSLNDLAEATTVPEQDVRAVYDAEVADFEATPKLSVAHILIEDGENKDALVEEVSQKLEAGADFSELAREYSDDLGSRSQGGELGTLVEEAFPPEFVKAAKQLEVDQISEAVKTDAGTHFIRVLEKSNAAPPTFAERKAVIERQLARQVAVDEYRQKVAQLEEAAFGADSLRPAAEALGLTVKTSPEFSRRGGSGIASNREVVNATFAEDVLKQGYNSRVLEIDGDRAVVVRVQEHKPEQVRPLAEVEGQIEQQLRNRKQSQLLAERAQQLIEKIQAGQSAQSLAEEAGLEFKLHEAVERTTAGINNAVLQEAFSLPRPEGEPIVDQVMLPGGAVQVIGLRSVEDGSVESLAPEQLAGLKRQLSFQLSQTEMSAFENAIIEKAKIEMP